MAISIGRLGTLGLGIEDTAGSPVSADIYVQYTENTLRGRHEPIEIAASKAARTMDKDSVVGKKWSEGDVGSILDVVGSGYFFKLALGQEVYTAGTPSVHEFFTTVSGNTPTTATLIYNRGTDVERYTFGSIDELTMEVSDGLAMLTASFMGEFPETVAAPVFTTTSGTHLSFKDMAVKFGTDLTTASSASATPVNDLSLTIANNLEVIYRSGSSEVSTIRTKGVRISGSYTVYFESETDKNAYYALNKRAMEITFTGNANEDVRIRIPRFRLNEGEVSTGLDDFYIITAEFTAEDYVDASVPCRLIDVRFRNSKASAY